MAHLPITGIILAGGQGSRMGCIDKGLQILGGKPMVAWVAERLAPQVEHLIVSANQNPERYGALLQAPVVADQIPGFAGPLAGLHSALAQVETPLAVSAPCDSPFLPRDLVARLLAALESSGARVAVARTGDQLHPVFCLYRREVLPHLADYLASGQRKIQHWHALLQAISVDFSDQAEAFRNINTATELATAGASLEHAGPD